MQRIARLCNEIQEYEWGSHTALAELLGARGPSAAPQAELWMGAHPKAPSRVLLDGGLDGGLDSGLDGEKVSLLELIRRDPEAVLGARVARRFGGELPFLFKLLAAEAPLSLQAHPDAAQAAAGFRREGERGLADDARERCYRDPHHKPELLCALTPFRALKGFRRIPDALERLERLELPGLGELLGRFRSAPTRSGLARFFHALLALPAERRCQLASAAAERAARLADEDRAFAWTGLLARHHPGDIGVLAAILLNPVELAPGQAIYLPAGELHAYLGGVAIELMANSDNVLRGGLTRKHVDVDELSRVLSFADGDAEVLEPEPRAAGEAVYRTPAAEFELAVLRVGPGAPYTSRGGGGVEILVGTRGAGRIEALAGGAGLEWRRGVSLLVPAAAGRYRLLGDGELYRAGVPPA